MSVSLLLQFNGVTFVTEFRTSKDSQLYSPSGLSAPSQHRGGVPRVSVFTGLDHWTGLLDWTTGLEDHAQNHAQMLENTEY